MNDINEKSWWPIVTIIVIIAFLGIIELWAWYG